MADHYTKQLSPVLFRRHVDYIMGHVPPKYSACFQATYDTLKRQLLRKPLTTPHPKLPLPLRNITNMPTTAAAAKFVLDSWALILGTSDVLNSHHDL